jgi:hypothetical protein
MQVFQLEVDNNLGASFVILGLRVYKPTPTILSGLNLTSKPQQFGSSGHLPHGWRLMPRTEAKFLSLSNLCAFCYM